MKVLKSNIVKATDIAVLIHGGVGRIHKEPLSHEK